MSTPSHLLVVDDEQNIRLTLNALLGRSGYTVSTAANAAEALSLFEREAFDLMLVDLQMPGLNGLQLVELMRKQGVDTAVIVLTGHGSLESAIEGMHLGVFDYILKTSDPAHIISRVQAGLDERARRKRHSSLLSSIDAAVQELAGNRTGASTAEAAPIAPVRIMNIGALQLNTWHQTATLEGRSLSLTPTEFRLLLCLAEHVGQMIAYAQLVRCAQGYETSELEAGELIKPHIHHLRQKLEPDPSNPRYLLNVRGKGYILQVA